MQRWLSAFKWEVIQGYTSKNAVRGTGGTAREGSLSTGHQEGQRSVTLRRNVGSFTPHTPQEGGACVFTCRSHHGLLQEVWGGEEKRRKASVAQRSGPAVYGSGALEQAPASRGVPRGWGAGDDTGSQAQGAPIWQRASERAAVAAAAAGEKKKMSKRRWAPAPWGGQQGTRKHGLWASNTQTLACIAGSSHNVRKVTSLHFLMWGEWVYKQ